MEIIDDRSGVETWRRDKRAPNQIRPPGSEKGLLHRADGSARINQGKTSVIASVFGPGDIDSRRGTQSFRNKHIITYYLHSSNLFTNIV